MKENHNRLPVELIRELLTYDRDTGRFEWLPRRLDYFKDRDSRICATWNSRYAGKSAGHLKSNGYVTIAVLSVSFKAHRLAWVFEYGEWPTIGLDHINLDRADNRICNLRLATDSQNQANTAARIDNTSGQKGVCWNTRDRRWVVQIQVRGRGIRVGNFKNLEDAVAAYRKAAIAHFGEFARLEAAE